LLLLLLLLLLLFLLLFCLFPFSIDTYVARLLKEKGGRITLIPLNRLAVKEPTYPRTETTLPLIDRLKFKPTFRKAFLHVRFYIYFFSSVG
jgi:chromosome segregation ATPase